jgi:hypothetical protein
MFNSTPISVNTNTVGQPPIWNATNQAINVSLWTPPPTNSATAIGGGSDVTFTRTANTLTIKLVGGGGGTAPITNWHVNSNASISQSKLNMQAANTSSVSTSFSTPNQSLLGLAAFDNTYFTANNGFIGLRTPSTLLVNVSCCVGNPLTFGAGLCFSQINTGTFDGSIPQTVCVNASCSATPNTVVCRNGTGGGNFAAGVITATLNGSACCAMCACCLVSDSDVYNGQVKACASISACTIVQRDGNCNITAKCYIGMALTSCCACCVNNALTAGTGLCPGPSMAASFDGHEPITFNVCACADNSSSNIVCRDGSGNFKACCVCAVGSFYGPLSGLASCASCVVNALSVASGVGLSMSSSPAGTTTYNGSVAITLTTNATDAKTASTIMCRDSSGNVAACCITACCLVATCFIGTASWAVNALTVGVTNCAYCIRGDSGSEAWIQACKGKMGNTIVQRDVDANICGCCFVGDKVMACATCAFYGDLAENYKADCCYLPCTVLAFGGVCEVTVASKGTRSVAGVVSTNPAHLMNTGLTGTNVVALALTGRVPCKVTGTVRKGDLMIAAGNGFAMSDPDPKLGSIIGKALEDFDGEEGVIEIVVGRF